MNDNHPAIEDILNAYRMGLFPMADSAESDIFYWYDPEVRGQLPIEDLHVSRSLRRLIRQTPFTLTTDQAFTKVINGCAESTGERPKTWINRPIRDMFIAMHEAGHAHSVECWQGDTLAGGLYGLAFGSVFAGESMFSRVSGASKIALVYLCARLWKGGFEVLDTQFTNPHLMQFGAYEISRSQYKARLAEAIYAEADFTLTDFGSLPPYELIQQYLMVNRRQPPAR